MDNYYIPEPILKAGILNLNNLSAAALEKGVLIKWI